MIHGLQPGDVLAVRTRARWGWLIRLGAALAGKPDLQDHVAIVHHWDANGTLWVIEGRPGGVAWQDGKDYLASPWTISNVEQVKADAQREVICDGARAMVGMRYDWEAIAGDGLDDLHLWDPVNGTVHGEVVCSSLAVFLYDKAALPRPAGGERKIQPADWTTWILTRGWAGTG